MAPAATTWSGRSSSSIFRGVLSGVLLVAALIVGLLGMHTLNLHGTAAADSPAVVAMSADESASAHHGAVPAHASGTATGSTGTPCTDCGTDDHAGMAMMCVLALLLALVIFFAPGVLRDWSRLLLRSPLLAFTRARALPRAPSLHVLCISRT